MVLRRKKKKMKNKIHIGGDHAGFELKKTIKLHLEKEGYEVFDHGADEFDENDDYPEFVVSVARELTIDPESMGIIFGGSGQGEAMVANRFPGIRATVYYGEKDDDNSLDIIKLSRSHNDANILSLGARFLSEEEAVEAVDLWLDTAFSGEERHIRRIEEINNLK
ncbi:MAG: ribose 5-phosphate isomerase B [Candidatus Paceibacteria bacterium]|jgi:ribose 5-phosphate isomerase B